MRYAITMTQGVGQLMDMSMNYNGGGPSTDFMSS